MKSTDVHSLLERLHGGGQEIWCVLHLPGRVDDGKGLVKVRYRPLEYCPARSELWLVKKRIYCLVPNPVAGDNCLHFSIFDHF